MLAPIEIVDLIDETTATIAGLDVVMDDRPPLRPLALKWRSSFAIRKERLVEYLHRAENQRCFVNTPKEVANG